MLSIEIHERPQLGYGLGLPAELLPGKQSGYEAGLQPLATARGLHPCIGSSLMARGDEKLATPQSLKDAQGLRGAACRQKPGGQDLETPAMLRELRARISS